MARSGSPSPRRGRSRRRWVTADGTPVSRPEPEQVPDTAPTEPGVGPPAATHRMPPPAAPVAGTRRPEPRRRDPWHV
ncbi:MAG TPA: hypothetical protein VD813_15990, partial [Pseudonocardia sp.]|nr:hypothetical protein [Pseudonocardia sp.]